MPVKTGAGDAAIARATCSLSKAIRSVREPPPRTIAMTSTDRCANVASAAQMAASARTPCTCTSMCCTCHEMLELVSSVMKS